MIDEKRLEQEYRRLQESTAPDLWDRIEGRLQEHPERETAARQDDAADWEADTIIRKKPGWARFVNRHGYGITVAAAVLAVTVGMNVARNSGNMKTENIAGAMETTMAAAATEAATQDYGQDGSTSVEETFQAEADRPDDTAPAPAEGVVTWQQLAIADYSALPVPERAVTVPEDSWYFSEDILADTGLLCGAGVGKVSFEYDNSGNAVKVVYDLTIDEIYYAEDYVSSGRQIQVKSPIIEAEGDEAFLLYQLQAGSTYLLPLKQSEGTWELLYPFAPQVQVLKDGGYLFHSGYTSLMDSTASVVIGQQQAANDYYYDRMLFRNDDSFLSDFLSLVER